MKILHVISSIDPRTGGPATALAGLTTAQHAAGLDVRVVSTFSADYKSDLADKLVEQGIKVRVVGPVRGALGRHPELVPTLKHAILDADIVHIHAVWEEIQHQAAVICRTNNKPYIIRPCGMLDPWSLKQNKWKKKIYMALRLNRDLNAAHGIHLASRTEGELVALLRLAAPLIVEPNGVSLNEYVNLPASGEFRLQYPQIRNRPIIAFLGRIYPGKGLELIVPALAHLKNTDAILVAIGPDVQNYRSQIMAKAQALGITERILFTGMLTGRAKIAALADADLFALPSEHENFGIAVVEALAAGTPVIISDQVNLCSDILQGRVGGVVPCEVDALAKELDRWLADGELRRASAQRARPFVWERYDWNQIARRWEEHYRRIIDANGK